MLCRLKLRILLQGVTLFLLGPACEATSLGFTVHVVPLESDGGKTVRAHFSAIAPTPCPSMSALCAEGEDCVVHTTASPLNGTKPKPGWCVRQWQKNVPSNYKGTINLGPDTELYVSMNAEPLVRKSSGKLNHPAFVALPPPIRARVNCPHSFHLSVKDLDDDKVQCRFARADQEECMNCARHSFIELDEEKCMLTFTGKASAGQYYIYLMVEDRFPVFKANHVTDNKPLSTVPVHLSLTVEESSTNCNEEPLVTGETPKEGSKLFVLPYEDVKFNVSFMSQLESVVEVAVVGPPNLLRVGFKTVGPMTTMTIAWVHSPNNLTQLLPICFAVNTKSLQSSPRCVWLYQREMRTLPAGTELTCEKTEMVLVLPITSLSNINLAELQLNSPACPVNYNSTHLTAHISLNGCGTKAVQSGSELVYTNTLKSVRPYTVIDNKPSLILPLACRIPGLQAKGPHYNLSMPTERETFGEIDVWVEVHMPGEGPMSNSTRNSIFRIPQGDPNRMRREAESESKSNHTHVTSTSMPIGSRIPSLDINVLSNCSVEGAEMIVNQCVESDTEDFIESHPLVQQGCTSSSDLIQELEISQTNSRVYRIDLSKVKNQGSTMYIQCKVNLCITTSPDHKCPSLCKHNFTQRTMVSSLLTRTYTIKSGPVSLVVTTPAPATATPPGTTSHAPKHTSAVAAGVIVTIVTIFLQNVFLY